MKRNIWILFSGLIFCAVCFYFKVPNYHGGSIKAISTGPSKIQIVNLELHRLGAKYVSSNQESDLLSDQYHTRAIALICQDADKFARDIGLEEELPINPGTIVKSFVVTPRLFKGIGQIGNVSSKHYTYFVNYGYKLSTIDRNDVSDQYEILKKKYGDGSFSVDTNAAFTFATNLLAKASMDLNGILRDGNLRVVCPVLGNPEKNNCIPIYSVYWLSNRNSSERGTLAFLEFCLPSKTLLQFCVSRPSYNLRNTLVMPEL